MLIDTPAGIINTAHVASVKVERSEAWEERCTVTFVDGRTETIACSIGLFERACGTVVPAQPGFTLIKALLPDRNEDGIVYSEEPVIAFRLAGSAEAMPITVSGEAGRADEGQSWCIRQPNGMCFGPGITNENEAAFRSMCEHEVVERRKP